MVATVNVSVYQNPLVKEGELLFQEDTLSFLLAKCEELFLKSNHRENYPEKEISKRVGKLVDSISLEESIRIKVTGEDFNWQDLLTYLERYYPQIVWVSGRKNQIDQSYQFGFIPIVLNQTGFPFGFSLDKSLKQQELIPEDKQTIIEAWSADLNTIIADYIALGDGYVEDFIAYDNLLAGVNAQIPGKNEKTENPNELTSYGTKFDVDGGQLTNQYLPSVENLSREQLIVENTKLRKQVKLLTFELIEAQKAINLLNNGSKANQSDGKSGKPEAAMADLLEKTNQQLTMLTKQLTAQEMTNIHHLANRDLVIPGESD